jgi:hypothetical protein
MLLLAGLPPRLAAAKLRDRVARRLLARSLRRHDAAAHTFGPLQAGDLARLVQAPDAGSLPGADEVVAMAAHHLEHRWDLLGSGWVQVCYGMSCRGVEGVVHPPADGGDSADALAARLHPADRDEARRVRALIGPGYVPVDWQLDFKSGFRWSESAWYADVRYGGVPGADVKVPWELSRMQHLPGLAWAYALARAGHPAAAPAERYAAEFRGQVLDWIAANPPRRGVNWAGPMDVAIRAANWALAYDLFRAWGARFDPAFTAELVRSLRAHGRHLSANLEWDPRVRGNHYLADVLGLLFIGAYLPRGRQADAWLAFGAQELLAETRFQFLDEGTSFEASTAYHRLSAEMALLGSALLLGLPGEQADALRRYDARAHRWGPGLRRGPLAEHDTGAGGVRTFLPADHVRRMARMARFLVDVAKPGPRAHLVGDDDSGRFARLWPACDLRTAADARARLATLDGFHALPDDAPWPDVRHADHRGTVAMAAALLDDPALAAFSAAGAADGAVARALARGRRLRAPDVVADGGPADRSPSTGTNVSGDSPPPVPDHARVQVFPVEGGGVLRGMAEVAYPGFGLYILRSERLYLAVRCGGGAGLTGGHAHADQLSLELSVDGVDWIADPGSYLYTPFPALRDRYRSVEMHFAPRVPGREPVRLGPGLFRLADASAARCLHFGGGVFVGVHHGYGAPVYRRVEVTDGAVTVRDWMADGTGLAPARVSPGAMAGEGGVYADGYGRRVR